MRSLKTSKNNVIPIIFVVSAVPVPGTAGYDMTRFISDIHFNLLIYNLLQYYFGGSPFYSNFSENLYLKLKSIIMEVVI